MFKKNLILLLVIVSALTISGAAAYFSVYGLSKLFAGAGLSVIIMASVLEASKLITAFTLHDRKKDLPRLLRVYLSIAVAILMIITSAGIYGFLSNAYQITATKNNIVEQEVSIIDARVENLDIRLKDAQSERDAIVKDINQLRSGLSSGTQISYIDEATGQKITTTSSATRKSLEAQLSDAVSRRDIVSSKIENLSAQIDSFKIDVLLKESNNEAAAELGPLIYLSKITGLSMDRVINYFILMIIFVFDPLAITLVISISYLSGSNKEKNKIVVNKENTILKDLDGYDVKKEEDKLIEAFNNRAKAVTSTAKRSVKKVDSKKDNLTVSNPRSKVTSKTVKGKPVADVKKKNQVTKKK